MSTFNTIDEILEDLRRGKMAVIMDDEDRENEGDLIMAADSVGPQDVNFMARYGRGLICLTLTRERCRQLRLPLMVSETDQAHRTNFTLSIEAAEGVTTGISAHDRAHTVKTAVAAEARPEDLRQPGHIFPLMAQPGGVLTRAGHTEAGCDLARLAGFSPAAMIVEILNDDGTMARRPDLELFAKSHGLKIGTIADLIRYRLKNERSVERIYEDTVETEYGTFKLFCYEDHVNKTVHIGLVKGDLNSPAAPGARTHQRLAARRRRGAQRAAGLAAACGHAPRGERTLGSRRHFAPGGDAAAFHGQRPVAGRQDPKHPPPGRHGDPDLRNRRANPQGPRPEADARAEFAQAAAGSRSLRSRSDQL